MSTRSVDPDAQQLLQTTVNESVETGRFLEKTALQVRRPKEPWHLDALLERGLVREVGRYIVPRLAGLEACDTESARAELQAARELYPVLRQAYLDEPGKEWSAAELALRAGWPDGEAKLMRVLQVLVELNISSRWGNHQSTPWAVSSIALVPSIATMDPFAAPPNADAGEARGVIIEMRAFRALQRVVWAPDEVCLLAGPNGSGKSNLLAGLAFLQHFYWGGVATAAQLAGGAMRLRNLYASPGEPIVLALQVGEVRWAVELAQEGPGIHDFAGEIVRVGDEIVLKRARQSPSMYVHASRRPAGESCRLRVIYESEEVQEAERLQQRLQPLIDLVDGYRYYASYDLQKVRQQQGAHGDEILAPDGANLVQLLRSWQSAPMRFRDQFAWVMRELQKAFPEAISHMEFDDVGPAVVARFYLPGTHDQGSWLPLHRASDGILVGLLHLAAIAGAPAGAMIAIDEMENHLHPHAIRSILSAMRELADERELTILLATHSPVLMNEFKDTPDHFYVTETGHERFPVPLDELHDREWLAHFALGDLYDRLEFGAPKVDREP